ncbi:hypothetical protein ACSSUR_04485 [Pseudomonas cedrina]|uniref:hypothetical protein n=1 Tax=Pseudomonas cedrina TaxID=651740 RepID=UPI003ED85F14
MTNLHQEILQVPTRCYPKPPDNASVYARMNAERAKGVGLALGGAVIQDVGQNMASRDGTLGKVVGTAMALGGKVAQLYGAEKIENADPYRR